MIRACPTPIARPTPSIRSRRSSSSSTSSSSSRSRRSRACSRTTRRGVESLRGLLVLAALWWAWAAYSWLTSATDVDEGGVRLTILGAMCAMFCAALAVPGAFGDHAVLFGVAYLLVRMLHLLLSTIVSRDDPDRRSALVRYMPTAIIGPLLILAAGFLDGNERIAVWVVALALDYLGPIVIGMRSRVAGRARALRRAARTDRPDRARRVDHRDRRRRRLRPGSGGDRGGGARNRRRLGALVALLRRRRDLRADAAQQASGVELHRIALARVQLPPPPDDRRHRALRTRAREDRRRTSMSGSRPSPRSRSASGPRSTSSATSRSCVRTTGRLFRRQDDRCDCVARPRSCGARDAGARGARARQRGVRGRRGVRGDSLSRAPAPGPAPDLRGRGGTRVPPPPPFATRGRRRAPG